MKVQCDVCEKAEAAVLCCADEAALCVECDLQVHGANKLVIKHQRVPLIKNPDAPRCDVCQEKTGYFFCLQDRALLCRNCDVSIHTANTLSTRHQRFLVTGIRVGLEAITAQERSVGSSEGSLKSATSNARPTLNARSSPITSPASKGSCPDILKHNAQKSSSAVTKPVALHLLSGQMSTSSIPSSVSGFASPETAPRSVSVITSLSETPCTASPLMQMISHPAPLSEPQYVNGYRQSSISEFLTEAIPGWRVDELLNLPELAGGYSFGDISSSKADAGHVGDFNWAADLSLFDEQVCSQAFHEVPELLPLGSYGLPQSRRLMTSTIKGKTKQDLGTLRELEDAFTVPDLGLRPLPGSPKFLKRRRQ